MRGIAWTCTLVSVAVSTASPTLAQNAGRDWPVWGGDTGGTKYSTLAQIDRTNVSRLAVAWTWETGEKPVPAPRLTNREVRVQPGSFEVTPIVINDTMYVVTPYNRVVALGARDGRVFWEYDPRAYDWGQPPNGTGYVHRGVAIWTGRDPESGRDQRRIFLNTRWRLIALDAASGKVIPTFGHRGEIDLTEHLPWPTNRLHYTQTSPAVIYRDLVIIGNGVGDRLVYRNDPPGLMQAFDVRTGKLVWKFNLIPQDGELGAETWEGGSSREWGHVNVWAPFTLDAQRGLLYLPVTTPSSDYYGGHRKGDNLFAESLLCLDAATGRRVWHFQLVRHGLWDYDGAAGPPALLTMRANGRTIDAVAATAKTGFLYVFDRVTGAPVWPIEDRPVPPSDVPGERAARTQPFPTRPAPYARQGFTESDLIDFTPELRAQALEVIRGLRYGQLYTPPSLEGTIALPGILGGANWGGPAVDPETGVLYVKASNQPALHKLARSDGTRSEADYEVDRERRNLALPNGLPILKPPYGTLTAVDLNTGEHRWQVPVGDSPEVREHAALRGVSLPAKLGAVGATGPIVTRGGLVFVTGGSNSLHAFHSATGELLWEYDLGNRSNANPMTYQAGDGRQYVAIAVGEGETAKLVVFALSGGR
ncbi:MAG: pyrroloquinoline quinone-dependent dehydrogenase [Gemmatimonadetes bacterium]|nr:pyrroloquinoline quinone-dependent dehydrogenase [Gemmatimonadota bacterium]